MIEEADEILVRREAELKDLEQQETDASTIEADAQQNHQKLQTELESAEQHLAQLSEQTANAKARRQSQEEMRLERVRAANQIESQLASLAQQALAIAAGAPDAAKLAATHESGQRLAQDLADIERQAIAAEELAAKEAANATERRQAAARAVLKASELKTERETLAKLVTPTNDGTWPAIVDDVQVAAGYEAALGAALGDDLDAPAAPDAPVHWHQTDGGDSDARLPMGGSTVNRPCHGTT